MPPTDLEAPEKHHLERKDGQIGRGRYLHATGKPAEIPTSTKSVAHTDDSNVKALKPALAQVRQETFGVADSFLRSLHLLLGNFDAEPHPRDVRKALVEQDRDVPAGQPHVPRQPLDGGPSNAVDACWRLAVNDNHARPLCPHLLQQRYQPPRMRRYRVCPLGPLDRPTKAGRTSHGRPVSWHDAIARPMH